MNGIEGRTESDLKSAPAAKVSERADNMERMKTKKNILLREVTGIIFMTIPFIVLFTPLSAWCANIFGLNMNTLGSVIVFLIFVVVIPAAISAGAVYSLAFKEKIKLFKIIYVVDIFLFCLAILLLLLWCMVSPI